MIWNWRATGSSISRPNITMSPPAEKALPTPVVTTARTSSSSVSLRQIVAKAWCTSSLTALNASGRLMLTTCTAPRFSTSSQGANSS